MTLSRRPEFPSKHPREAVQMQLQLQGPEGSSAGVQYHTHN